AMSADDHWQSNPWYEAPRDDPSLPEVYTYTNAMSYDPNDEVVFHTSTTAPIWTLEIYRDGYQPQTVNKVDAIAGVHTPTPPEAYRTGCGWPVSHRSRVPRDVRSGFYRVVSTCARANGSKFVQHLFLSCDRRMRHARRRFWSFCPQARGRLTTISGAPITTLAWPDRSGTSPRRCFRWRGHGRAASSGCRLARRASARTRFRNSAPPRVIRRWSGRMRTVSASITRPRAGRSSIGTSWSG